MRRLLPVVGLLLLLILAAGAAFVVLGGSGEETASGPGGGNPSGAASDADGSDRGSGDGNRARAGAPGRIRGVVRLLAEDAPAPGVAVTLGTPDREPFTAYTDADGSFEFKSVVPSQPWDLAIAHGEYAPLLRPGLVVEAKRTLDLGTLFLASGVPVVVEVHRLDGTPLAGALVGAYVPGEGTATFDLPHAVRPVATIPTDAKGEAHFPALPPGTWTFTAERPGYAKRGLPGALVHAGSEGERFRLVLERGYSLSGLVIDHDGRPVPGAPLLAIRRTLTSDQSTAPLAVRGVSEADGRYRLDGLPGQDMVIWAGWPGKRLGVLAAVRLPGVTELDLVLERGGRIEGRVVKADGGDAVEGATVTASLSVLNAFSLQFETVTDDSGHFVFDMPMPGGIESLGATAAGLGSGVAQLGYGGEIQLPEGYTATRDIRLGSAGTVSGVIRGPDGPLVGAMVGATNREWWTGVQTNAGGRYELTELPSARYMIVVSRAGLTQPDKPDNPDASLGDGTAPEKYVADLTSADRLEIDIQMERVGDISGRIVDAEDKPIPGATVSASDAGSVGATADADGRFVIPGSPSDNVYSVDVSHERFRTKTENVPFLVEGAEPPEMLIKLSIAPLIQGTVVDVNGSVPDGAYVQVVQWDPDLRDPVAEEWSWLSAARLPVDANGRFEHRANSGFDSGRIEVRAGAPGYAFVGSGSLRLPTDATPLEVLLTLTPGDTIRGRIETLDGSPVPRAFVGAMAAGAGSGPQDVRYPGAWGSPIVAVSGADGRFTIAALREGRYILRAWSREHVEKRLAVDAPTDEEVVLQLGSSLSISGRVVIDGPGSAAGAEVDAENEDDWTLGRVATDGTFRLEGLSPGTYEVTLRPAPDDRQNVQTTTVSGVEAGTSNLVVNAQTGNVLSGLVVDADGTPQTEQYVALWRDDTHFLNMMTDDAGRFEIPGLDEGTYTVEISSETLEGIGNLFVHGVRAAEHRFVLPAPVAVSGRLLMPAGDGTLGATGLSFSPREPSATATGSTFPSGLTAQTDDEGRFETVLAPNTVYVVTLPSHPTLTLPKNTEVRAGQGEIRLTASAGLTIDGSVVDETGAPLAGAHVWTGGDGINRSAATDKDGAFRLSGLDEQPEYVVGASADGFMNTSSMGKPGERVELRMQRGFALGGRIVDETGDPFGDVQVRLTLIDNEDSSYETTAWADTDGNFSGGDAHAGRYEVRVHTGRAGIVLVGVIEAGSTGTVLRVTR